MERLLNLYDSEPDRQAILLFINWFRQLAAHGRLSGTDFAQIEEQDLTREEVKSMLVKALEREREVIFDNGKKEGIDIGKKEGIDIGKKEGFDERNRQIVQAMVANGFPLPTIAELLALSLPEVERLLVEHEDAANEVLDSIHPLSPMGNVE